MKKFSLFGLTFGRKRSRDSVTGGPIFANLVSKYPQDFKEKSHEAARLKARRLCVRCKICHGDKSIPANCPYFDYKERGEQICHDFCKNLSLVMCRKFRNVLILKNWPPICSCFLGFEVGRYASPYTQCHVLSNLTTKFPVP